MTRRSDSLLLWAPRVLGILVCLFLSLLHRRNLRHVS